jgi:hypothetical protein
LYSLDADDADYKDYEYKELNDEIIKILYRVYKRLVYDFLEKEINICIKPKVIKCLMFSKMVISVYLWKSVSYFYNPTPSITA